jgi:SpoIID/LytB domain protein
MPRRTSLLAALAVVGGLVAGGSPAIGASAAREIQVPDHATLKIAGRGYGHGHGLSQYGAEGAARQGLSAGQIVAFYYPHTHGGRAGGSVRVLISADTDDNTTVLARSGLKVHDLGDRSTTPVPTKGAAATASRWRLSAGRSGRTKVSFRTGGSWHVWRTLVGDGEFRAGKPITLVVGSHRVTYRGSLQSRTPAGGAVTRRITVNRVPLEAYVQGVIPQEMPASWHQAALRAQAIAARTYAAFEARNSTNPLYNLCDTSACQVYGGMSAEFPTTNQATAKTAGRIRTYQGAPAFTQFSSSNGGWTAAGSEPYLVAEPDPYDGWSGNPNHTWTTKVKATSIEKAFPALGKLRSISVTQRDGHGQWHGRVEKMKLVGSKGTLTPTGDDFRTALGLRSTWFNISVAST